MAIPQEHGGAQPTRAVIWVVPLAHEGRGVRSRPAPRGPAHHSELLLRPVNVWGHAPGVLFLAGWLVCSNYLTNRTLNQEPATQPAFWLLVEVDVSPKMYPCPCAPNAWASKATTKKPCPTLERIAGCWCLDLAEYVGGRYSSLGCGAAGLKSLGVGGR